MLAANRTEDTQVLPIPKGKAKIAEKSGCSQSFTKQVYPMPKVVSVKKLKREKKKNKKQRKGEG